MTDDDRHDRSAGESDASAEREPEPEPELGPRPGQDPPNGRIQDGSDSVEQRPVIGGRYQVHRDEELSTTGKHHVVAGHDLRSREKVVARTLREPWREDPDEIARFRREARMQAFIKHPHFVRVEAFAEEPDGFWVVQEHLPGGSLADRIDRDGVIPVEDLAPVLEQVADALAELHRQGASHLALSPRKVVYAEDGLHVKLVDLGFACPIGDALEAAELSPHAVPFRAPEVAAGEGAGPESDLFALGAMTFLALTGKTPGDAASGAIEGEVSMVDGVPLAASIHPDVPAWVDEVLAHALAPDPGARDPDIRMFARRYRAGIEGHLTGTPMDVPAPSVPAAVPGPRAGGQWVAPVSDPRIVAAAPGAETGEQRVERRKRERRPFDGIVPWLWRAAAALLVLDLLFAGVLLERDGAVPPFSRHQSERAAFGRFAPGALAVVAAGGFIARSGPGTGAAPAADLVSGEIVTIAGAPEVAGGEHWLPVTITRGGAQIEVWVRESWLRPRT